VSASVTVNSCGLKSKITGPGVSPHSHISAPFGVMGSTPRMDLAYQLKRSWRVSCLPTSLWYHQSSLPSSATTWSHVRLTALMLCGTTRYVFVTVPSMASAALAYLMHWLCCSLNIWCGSAQTIKPVYCLVVELYYPISNPHLWCLFWPEVSLGASSVHE